MQFSKIRRWGLTLFVTLLLAGTYSSASYGATSVWEAARNGNLKDVKLQIEKIGTDVDALDSLNNTPLVYAIIGGCPRVVEYLVEKGANLKQTTSYSGDFNFSGIDSGQCNPIQYAAVVWKTALRKYNHNGGNDGRGRQVGVPPLFEYAQCIRILQKANAKQGLKLTLPKEDSIDMAVILGDLDTVKRYVKAGSGITGFSLRYSVGFDDVETVKYFDFIEYIGDRETGSYGELIREGVEFSAYQSLNYFFESGKSPDTPDEFGTTPLITAARNGNNAMFQYLLEKGANIDGSPTALHIASGQNNLELVKIILAKGVKIDVRDSVKQTPLHAAAEAGHLEMVKFLVANGADPVAHGNGSLPYDLAKKNHHEDVMAFLKPYTDKYYEKFN